MKQGNISALRCYSTRVAAPTYSAGQFSCLPKPITFRNALCPTSSQVDKYYFVITNSLALSYLKIISWRYIQLTKITANSLIQTRSQSTHGDHVNLWKLERIVSAAFVPLLPLCLLLDNPVLDGLLAVLSVIHVHW